MASLSILWLLSAALCQVTACFFPIFSRHIAGARSGEETSARAPGRRNVLSTSEHRIVIMTWRARRVSHGPRDRVRFDQQCNMPEKKRSERAREGGRIGETLNITYNAITRREGERHPHGTGRHRRYSEARSPSSESTLHERTTSIVLEVPS